MVTAMATSVSLSRPFCRCASAEPAVVAAASSTSRSCLKLQLGRRKQFKRLQNVAAAGLWQQQRSTGRSIIIKAMAEDSSSESAGTTTEDRVLSPEEEEDQANISEIMRV